jgi:hypothetical protein
VAAVRQGHTYLYPASTQKKGNESTEEKGTGPFSQFDYFDNKLYVVKISLTTPA